MKILYLNTHSSVARSEYCSAISRYEVIESNTFDDSLRLLKTSCFDVLVIAEQGHRDTVLFVMNARTVRPHLPIFVTSAWGADLGMALSSIAEVNELATASCASSQDIASSR